MYVTERPRCGSHTSFAQRSSCLWGIHRSPRDDRATRKIDPSGRLPSGLSKRESLPRPVSGSGFPNVRVSPQLRIRKHGSRSGVGGDTAKIPTLSGGAVSFPWGSYLVFVEGDRSAHFLVVAACLVTTPGQMAAPAKPLFPIAFSGIELTYGMSAHRRHRYKAVSVGPSSWIRL